MIRVNRKKLFEVMRGYGVQEILVDVIERIYSGSMVKFELESIMTAWCKSDSGARQGCPLSGVRVTLGRDRDIPCIHYCLTYMSEN